MSGFAEVIPPGYSRALLACEPSSPGPGNVYPRCAFLCHLLVFCLFRVSASPPSLPHSPLKFTSYKQGCCCRFPPSITGISTKAIFFFQIV